VYQAGLKMKNLSTLLFLLGALPSFAAVAPDFTVTSSDNQVRHLYADYVNQQKVMVIELFFTTCLPCATHAPFWQSLYQSQLAAHPGQVEFMMLSTLASDTNAKVAAYKTSRGLTMLGVGTDGGSAAARQPYTNGLFGLYEGTPTFIVIAPGTGEVFYNIQGVSPQQTMSLLSQKIAELLPSTPVPTPCFLKSYYDQPLDSVLIAVDAPAFDTTFLAAGSYSLANIAALQNVAYTVTATKNSAALDGISTSDLLVISRHILSLEALSPTWKTLAADINCSGSITASDIVIARKLILGIETALPCAKWRFVAEPVVSTANGTCVNFRGVKMGELNGVY